MGAGFDSVFDLDGDFVHTVWVVSLFGEIYTDAVEEGLEVVLFFVEPPPFVSEDVLPESCHLEGFEIPCFWMVWLLPGEHSFSFNHQARRVFA